MGYILVFAIVYDIRSRLHFRYNVLFQNSLVYVERHAFRG